VNRRTNSAMKFYFPLTVLLFFAVLTSGLFAQEDETVPDEGTFGFGESTGTFGFGDNTGSFGFDNEAEKSLSGNMPDVKIGGKVSASLLFFTEGFGSSEKTKEMKPGDIFEGKLDFSAQGKAADGIINLKIKPDFSGGSPVSIDEAYLRLYFGPVDVEGGLRKLSWGRADSFGPLDVINPIDYTDLSAMGNPRSIKIARPMLHASWAINSFSKLEGVFVPWFAGNEYAMSGRWAPDEINTLSTTIGKIMNDDAFDIMSDTSLSDLQKFLLLQSINNLQNNLQNGGIYPNTKTLQYAQGGLRFTTTLNSSDFGVQYYFGRLPRPAINSPVLAGFLYGTYNVVQNQELLFSLVDYNYYHHIGVDYAQVLAGFNVRAEAGANITGDLKGDDGAVYNPHAVWSLGFDRDLFWEINLNLQGNGLVRLMYDKISDNPMLDTEAGKDRTSTRITAILSKKFLMDELEIKTTALWGIEDRDFLIIPAIIWSKNDIAVEFSAGIFGGDKAGELGQYRDNCYVKTVLSWSF